MRKRILIVDDSEDMRQLLTQILEEEELYDLYLAESGVEALAQALRVKPDLILMDMSLPGMTGWEAVSQLRKLDDFKETPIVAVTAHVSPADQKRTRAIGCNEHLGKPFDVIHVLDIVERLLEESR
ncbi:response regulator [Ktedonospora formicarum]|uniref:response regulator n=1 Tax=Ktedonospora formicarum TaxID=2778364 RepID=UPI001C688D35|nr:response regulator [Ktedonospora formicarum]